MSKQDGYASRTAADLERKYNFGKTFADVYGLVADARKIAEEAQSAYDGLTQSEIFNLLTDFGESQGVYRDDKDNVYINASYIKSGTISGDNVKVAAAVIDGKLTAAQIDATNLKVDAANIKGKLSAGAIDTTNLSVSAANITGTLSASIISGGTLDFTNISTANLSADYIVGGTIRGSSLVTKAGKYSTMTIDEDSIYIGTTMYFRSIQYGNDWALQVANTAGYLVLGGYDGVRVYHNGRTGRYWTFEEYGLCLWNADGSKVGQITVT